VAPSFLFYDYETDGADPACCRPTQFACIRTDEHLDPVPGPEGQGLIRWYRPPEDHLPAPEAVLVTGITPQHAMVEGRTDNEFFSEIHELFNKPCTTSLGWNSLRFDDIVNRFGFWRTLQDPYAHGYANGCRVWDLIDLARACYALRPSGIIWPAYVDGPWSETREPVAPSDGPPAFKLDMLAPANGIEHSGAHDALADVRATIEMARLIKAAQPKLWDLAYSLTNKKTASNLLVSGKPLVHVSPKIANTKGCASLVYVVGRNPRNPSEFIAWDLRDDPSELIEADVETIRSRTFVSRQELEEQGLQRFALKGIKSNRAPIIIEATPELMKSIDTDRIHLDLDTCRANYSKLAVHAERLKPVIAEAWNRPMVPAKDSDDALYDNFVEPQDRAICNTVRAADQAALADLASLFEDHRLPDLLLHFRARNFQESLDDAELARWHTRCADRLANPPGRGDLAWPEWLAHITDVINDPDLDRESRQHLEATADWGRELASRLGLPMPSPTG